jgi:hypothetical protein
MNENEGESPGEVKPESEREAGKIAYLEGLDELRQQAGVTAAMLRDGRAKQMVETFRGQSNILVDDLRLAWRHAVRAFNYCENDGLKDTSAAMMEIITKLSQQLDFAETIT